eukprot:TRINITY_DN7083_c0_g2_i1.p1 TRINITY_DN7083_c0_g2~~TRINITY_DN7083_c0_g2_i1.p1  ORF type:complete len:179 (+),score=23.59 TRINITY_DN7083_c0_g2_i1:294-830(+)
MEEIGARTKMAYELWQASNPGDPQTYQEFMQDVGREMCEMGGAHPGPKEDAKKREAEYVVEYGRTHPRGPTTQLEKEEFEYGLSQARLGDQSMSFERFKELQEAFLGVQFPPKMKLLRYCDQCQEEEVNWKTTSLADQKPKPTFKRCSRCRVTYYCSRECQLKHWSVHKKTCKKPPAK